LPGINGHISSLRIIHSVSVNMFSDIAHLGQPWEGFVKLFYCNLDFDGEFWDPGCYLG